MRDRFDRASIHAPRLVSEMLLAHVLGGQRIDIYADADREASEDERAALRALVQRVLAHEPVQYIVGESWFLGRPFKVNADVLIPRAATESLVQQAMDWHRVWSGDGVPHIADVGTGSGCIAVSIALAIPGAELFATDICPDALTVAQHNARRHRCDDRIAFVEGDGIAALEDRGTFDLLCSNPPYVPKGDLATLDPNVRDWEPEVALHGGEDGMAVAGPLIRCASRVLAPGGRLLVEITTAATDAALTAAADGGFDDARITRDGHGDERFLAATLAGAERA